MNRFYVYEIEYRLPGETTPRIENIDLPNALISFIEALEELRADYSVKAEYKRDLSSMLPDDL